MGYFAKQSAALFKKDAQGCDLIFSWGNLGRGRVIRTEADGVAVRSPSSYGWRWRPSCLWVIRSEQWEIADERLTYREAMAGRGAGSLWFLAVLSALFVAGGLFLLLATDAAWIGLLCTLFFGACLGVFVWMLILRRRG